MTNYRGITLMNTAYKIYASVLNERIKHVVEDKLEKGQFGFRFGRGIVDALYAMNYVMNRGITKKEGKVFAFFADLKAAFDKVNRIKLQEMLRKVRIEEKLRKRIIETYKETKNMVRIGEKKS